MNGVASRVARHAGPAAWMSAAEVVPRIAGFGIQAIFARSLSAFEFGELSYALALALVVVPLAGLGAVEGLVRDGAARPDRFPEIFGSFARIRLETAGLTALAIAALALLHRPPLGAIVFAAGIFMLIRAWTQFRAAVERAAERIDREAWIRTAESILLLAAAAALAAARVAVLGAVATLAAVSAAFALFLRIARGPAPAAGPARKRLRSWLGSIPYGLAPLYGVIFLRLALVAFDRIARDPAATGRLGAAVNIVLFAALVPAAIPAALLPKLSRKSGELHAYRRELFLLLSAGTAIGVAIAGAIALVRVPLMRIAFGAPFVPAAPALSRLAPFLVTLSVAVAAATVLAAREKRRALFAALAIPALLECAIAPPLVAFRGLSGACDAASIAQALCAAICIFAIFDDLRARPEFSKKRQ